MLGRQRHPAGKQQTCHIVDHRAAELGIGDQALGGGGQVGQVFGWHGRRAAQRTARDLQYGIAFGDGLGLGHAEDRRVSAHGLFQLTHGAVHHQIDRAHQHQHVDLSRRHRRRGVDRLQRHARHPSGVHARLAQDDVQQLHVFVGATHHAHPALGQIGHLADLRAGRRDEQHRRLVQHGHGLAVLGHAVAAHHGKVHLARLMALAASAKLALRTRLSRTGARSACSLRANAASNWLWSRSSGPTATVSLVGSE